MAKGPDFALADAAGQGATDRARRAPSPLTPCATSFPRKREPTLIPMSFPRKRNLPPPALPYRPTNAGGRFSANAVCPSRRSSVSASIAEQRCSY